MLKFFEFMMITTLRMGTPIALTAVGACMAEQTGILNIGLEGIMTMGAFCAVAGSFLMGNPWYGILFAIIVGIIMSAIHAFVTVVCGGPMAVSAQALVLLGSGLSSVGLQMVFKQIGVSRQVVNMSSTPFLRSVPFVGPYLARLSPIVYLGFILLLAVHHFLYKMPLGLRMRACGEHPRAADTAGINVVRLRFLGVLVSGLFGGLGGAMLSLGSMNLFQEGMIAGRGYLAVGAVILGRWKPAGAFAAAMCFGFFDSLQLYLQTIPNAPIPSNFVQMVPYVASLLVLTFTMKEGVTGPAAVGQSYSNIAGTR